MHRITTSEAFGACIREARKALGLNQRDVADAASVGLRFIVDLERGKPTCELGKALVVATSLGLALRAEQSSRSDPLAVSADEV